ncbi:MAG: FAD-dependent oxidoreductase, partial [Thermoleophilia bacterium]
EYRLSASVVDGEIQRILDMGVVARTGEAVSDTAGLEALSDEFDAVFMAVGAQQAKTLPHIQDGAGAARVLDGLEYLRRCTEGVARDLGGRMIVIGGGSAAMDVARSARRLGHQVSVVALETRAVMPALPEEIEQALEEGVALFDGAMVSAVEEMAEAARGVSPAAPGAAADDGLTLRCVKVALDPAAPAGSLRPVPVEGSEFSVSADVIVTAIGQDPDLASYGDSLSVERALLSVDADTLATSRPGVFAGGDVASTSRFVSEAIGAGHRAAYGIAEHLGHPEARQLRRPILEEAVNRKEVNPFYFDFSERRERAVAPVAERLAGFAETVSAYSEAEAAAEAQRCMSCGLCVECDNCFVFCPDMAVQKKVADATGGASGPPPDSGPFYIVLDQYCKGCGLCVTECPRGAVRLEQVTR